MASRIRLGMMGFGHIGRQIYHLAAQSDDIEIVAITDIGQPEILLHLLCADTGTPENYHLEGQFLVTPNFKTRLLQMDRPAEIPWDIFGVDAVIEATGRFSEAGYMRDHLANGAKRVVLRTLPKDDIDRIVVPGVNGQSISCEDRMISAGSATTSALVLLLHTLSAKFEISCASMTTIHAYTSDQALQDYAGSDFRRSRSAAENIIPNSHEAATWLGHILPNFADKVLTAALNVPIQKGCLLDVNLVMADSAVTVEDINQVMRDSVADYRNIIDVVEDPIVSSDVIGNPHSLLFDTKGTIKAGAHTIKALAWYETLGHAARLLDVVRLYQHVDASREVA